MRVYKDIFNQIISIENLFLAWDRFKKNKKNRKDVGAFEWNLEENLFALGRELASKSYRHGSYSSFFVRDPKQRHIHKAPVRDRIVHHALTRILTIIFEPTFIPTSFSCRIGRGAHKGVRWLGKAIRKVSSNYTRPCFVLKCDVRKFFDSMNHDTLLAIIKRRITDPDALWLLEKVVRSYTNPAFTRERERERERRKRAADRSADRQPDLADVCEYLHERA